MKAGMNLLVANHLDDLEFEQQVSLYNVETLKSLQEITSSCLAEIRSKSNNEEQNDNEPLFQYPPDLKIKRGLGILENLINEKNPDFFRIQVQKKLATQPLGIPIKDIISRLTPQVRTYQEFEQQSTNASSSKPKNNESGHNEMMMHDIMVEEEEEKGDNKNISLDTTNKSNIFLEKNIQKLQNFNSDPFFSEQVPNKQIIEKFNPEVALNDSQIFNNSNLSIIPNQAKPIQASSHSSLQEEIKERLNEQNSVIIDDSPMIDEASIKHPYTYQKKIVEKVLKQWGMLQPQEEGDLNASTQMKDDDKQMIENYGAIIFIETGAGKSYISLMLIKSLFGEPHDKLAELSHEQLKQKRMNSAGNLLYDEKETSTRRKVVFIVPTNNLVDQQSSVLERYTQKVRVGKFQGGKNNKKVYKYENWVQQFRDNDVFVFIAKKFYDLLMHGYIKMEQIDLLILDEAHHTNQEHLYNLVMTDFYYSGYEPGLVNRPKILALTASPIKQKIEANKIYNYEIEEFLQSLADNLYSKFVSVSATDLEEMRNECTIEVMTYQSLFEFNAHTVKDIEQHLILKLLSLLSPEQLPPAFYKVQSATNPEEVKNARNMLLSYINKAVEEEFKMQQDAQILKFISTRKKFIDLEVDQSKRIDLGMFRHTEDRTLILLIIILLKNINNLIVELGMLGLQMFLIDLRKDLLEKQAEKFKSKAKPIIEIFNHFIDEMVAIETQNANRYAKMIAEKRIEEQKQRIDMNQNQAAKIIANSEISGKVSELLNILDKEYDKNPNLKAIVFVKDRSVATYLKKILDFMFPRMSSKMNEDNDLNSNFSSGMSFLKQNSSTFMELGESQKNNKFRCNFAIGFQGKSLTNKAYRSTKTMEDEIQQLEEFLPQFSHVKMTHQNLMKNIEDFKNDKINILIATSVIEEGLDVSTCNLVISINEVLNVKSFIQTKGRARQKNSKFIFLCAEEEKQEVCNTIEGFKKLILNIQEIAYSNGDKVILPNPNIINQKQKQPWMYIVTKPPFNAKCTIRESPTILELLCNELIEELNSQRILEHELRPQYEMMTIAQKQLMEVNDKTRHKRKIIVITEERSEAGKNKTFYSKLVVPEYLKYFFISNGGIIKSDMTFPKKKESENYVHLLAVKRLYEVGLFGEDLYPNLNRYLNQKAIDNFMVDSVMQTENDTHQVFQPSIPQRAIVVEKKNIPLQKAPIKPPPLPKLQQQQPSNQPTKAQVSQELMKAKKELQDKKELYTKESKKSCLPVPISSTYLHRDLNISSINEESKESVSKAKKQPKTDNLMHECVYEKDDSSLMSDIKVHNAKQLYILVFQGANTFINENIETQSSFCLRRRLLNSNKKPIDDSYPFKTLKESVGILWDRNLTSQEMKLFIELQQENRQKHKNAYYLEKLCELGLITDPQKELLLQNSEILEMRIESISYKECELEHLQKLEYFHFWFFHYVNNANYRFYKKILRGSFSFTNLFSKVLAFLKKAANQQKAKINIDFLEYIFKVKAESVNLNVQKKINLNTYLVPIIASKTKIIPQKVSFGVNWKLIDDLIDFVKCDLLNFCLTDNTLKSCIFDKYGLISTEFKLNGLPNQSQLHDNLALNVRNVWSCESNQNLFIVMTAAGTNDKLYSTGSLPLNTSRKIESKPLVSQLLSSHLTTELEHDTFWNYKNIAMSNNHSYNRQSQQPVNTGIYPVVPPQMNQSMISSSSKALNQSYAYGMMKSDNQTISEHYFAKTGIYLSRKDNQYVYKCSKERVLMDFSVQKSTLINNQAEENKQAQAIMAGGPVASKPPPGSMQSSTLFDVPQQLMKLLPLKYEQYQMLQLSNFCYASILEVVKVDNFIQDFLSDLNVHMEDPKDVLNLQQWHLTPRLEQHFKNTSSLDQSPEKLSTFIKQDFMIMVEAMTAPTANKPIDYERLEFYGDSVISFLVILELFLTTATGERNYQEGELDFLRIKAVSNMNLAQTNVQHKIFQYIITDSTKVIADDLSPPGFLANEYLTKIKAKTSNEIKTKLTYLKKCEIILRLRMATSLAKGLDKNVDADYIELVKMFIMSRELYSPLMQYFPDAWPIYEQERLAPQKISGNTDLIWRLSERWLYELGITLDHLRLSVVQYNIERVESKYRKEKNKKQQIAFQQAQAAALGKGKGKNKKNAFLNNQPVGKQEKMRHFQSKQLADTVESITGAIAHVGGLFSAQELLLKLGVLKSSVPEYEKDLNKFIAFNFNGGGYQFLMTKYSEQFLILEDIIGYKFKNPYLLVQAMTHKSFKEHFNNMREHQQSQIDMRIDDYERLEFLGDSILNFLIAQYYFTTTRDSPSDFQPKQLHKLKTSVVNNVFLSLVLVQRGVHNFVLYNQNSEGFKKQFDQYVEVVGGILNKALQNANNSVLDEKMQDLSQSSFIIEHADEDMLDNSLIPKIKHATRAEELSDQEFGNINIEPLYEHSLKIFGDIFESLIGAVFLDSKSISQTETILYSLLKPFLKNHTHVETLDDHSRTKLLELWNSKPYTKSFKIKHEVDQKPDGSAIFRGLVQKIEVRRVSFQKDMKNKVRRFYNDFFDFIESFIKHYEAKCGMDASQMDRELKEYRKSYKPPEKKEVE